MERRVYLAARISLSEEEHVMIVWVSSSSTHVVNLYSFTLSVIVADVIALVGLASRVTMIEANGSTIHNCSSGSVIFIAENTFSRFTTIFVFPNCPHELM